MSTIAVSYFDAVEKALDALPPGSAVMLDHLDWDDYENLLGEIDGVRNFKLMYDNGRLEAMTLSPEHEKPKIFLTSLIIILAEELDLKLIGHGSTTLRKKNKRKGADPDDSYYLENADQIRGKTRINLASDPPPDLAIEIDVTSYSLDKFAIYAALGVPEFWRYENKGMRFYRLEGGQYTETPVSDHFPFLTPQTLGDYLALGESEDITTMNRAFRKWVREHKPY
ncbi:MAG: Uma2 family endonuclease [Blastocatellia bacterium]